MNRRPLLILTDERYLDGLKSFMARAVPELECRYLTDLAGLKDAAHSLRHGRTIAFSTGTIVPPDLLNREGMPAYNIHPGTPEYPGAFPEIRAALDRASVFGATLHEMDERVDTGKIIAVETMASDLAADPAAMGLIGMECALVLLGTYARRIADTAKPLPQSHETWRGDVMTRAEVQKLAAGRFTY